MRSASSVIGVFAMGKWPPVKGWNVQIGREVRSPFEPRAFRKLDWDFSASNTGTRCGGCAGDYPGDVFRGVEVVARDGPEPDAIVPVGVELVAAQRRPEAEDLGRGWGKGAPPHRGLVAGQRRSIPAEL